jgi:hypothetical protein
MTNWHFRLRAGGTENSYYIVGSDRAQALYQAQQTLFEELKEQGVICLTAKIEFEERISILDEEFLPQCFYRIRHITLR